MAIAFTKTRIAPTPSGYLHLGNILSFGITTALAKKHGAKILLRIDDLDKVRANPAYVQDIFDTLNFLGIEWDEGPRDVADFDNNWSQLQRMDLYDSAIEQLKEADKLFACTCSRIKFAEHKCNCANKHLPFETPSANWRIFSDKCLVQVKEYNCTVIEAELPAEMQNFIVRKKDGYPSYQLASVIDDLHFGIDLIIRGQDLWESTLAQQFLAREINLTQFSEITFLHHPLIKDATDQKLSKSAGATSVKYLREHGLNAADIFSEVARLTGTNIRIETWQQFLTYLEEKYFDGPS